MDACFVKVLQGPLRQPTRPACYLDTQLLLGEFLRKDCTFHPIESLSVSSWRTSKAVRLAQQQLEHVKLTYLRVKLPYRFARPLRQILPLARGRNFCPLQGPTLAAPLWDSTEWCQGALFGSPCLELSFCSPLQGPCGSRDHMICLSITKGIAILRGL